MVNPVIAFVEKYAGPNLVPRLKQACLGIVADFWKDTSCEFPVIEVKLAGRSVKIPNYLKPMPPGGGTATASKPAAAQPATAPGQAEFKPRWHALPGEVAEKMWGPGYALPGGDVLTDKLVKPAGIAKPANVIDLSAGLGGAMYRLLPEVGQIRGYDMDPVLVEGCKALAIKAGRGAQLQVDVFNPASFTMPMIAEAVTARELLYRVADKQKLLGSIAAGIKIGGHFVFADYIVDPENKANPAIVSWLGQEKGAAPAGLIEMAELLAKAGFEMRENEDLTDLYKGEILKGLKRLAVFLAKSARPDVETKRQILHEIEVWLHRMGAIGQGMKFYRFHAVRS